MTSTPATGPRSARSFTRQLALLPLSVVLLLVVALATVAWREVMAELEQRAQEALDQRAAQLSSATERGLQSAVTSVRQLAHDRALQPLERPGGAAQARAALDRFIADHPGFVWAGLVDLQGRVIAGSRGWLEGQSITDRPVFAAVQAGLHVGEPHPAVMLSPLMRDAGIPEQQLVDIGETVRDDTGRSVAVLATHLGVSWVDEQVGSVLSEAQRLNAGIRARVMADAGRRQVAGEAPGRPDEGEGEGAGAQQAPSGTALRATRSVPFLPPLDHLRWEVVVEQDRSIAQAPGRRMLQSIGILGAVAAAVVALLGLLSARQLARPWQPMLDAVAARHAAEGAARGLSLLQVIDEVQAELRDRGQTPNAQSPSPAEALLVQLARDAGQLRRVLDHLPDAVAVVDAAGCIEHVNAAFCRRLGWTAADAVGHSEAALLLEPGAAPPTAGEAASRQLRTRLGPLLPVRWHRMALAAPEAAGVAPPAGWLSVFQDLQAEVQARARAEVLAAQLSALAAAAVDLMLVTVDGAGRVLEWNPGAQRLTGRSAEAALGQDLAGLLWPAGVAAAAPEAWRPDWQAVQRAGTPLPIARWSAGAAGQAFWGRGSLYPLPLDAHPAAFGLMLRDTTAEHEAGRRLADSEARLASAVIAADLGTWRYDIDTRVSEWNAREYELLGLPPGNGEATPEMFYRFVHPEDLPELLRIVDQAVATGQPFEHVWRIERADGALRWVAGRGQVVRDETGRVVSMAGVNFDITRRQESERALVNSQARLAAIVSGASDAIVSIDESGRITLFNPAAEAIFGWSSAQMLGEPLDRLLPPSSRHGHMARVRHFGRDDTAGPQASVVRRTAVRGVTATGADLELEASISHATVAGRMLFTSILRDVTERRRQERALARTRQELGELTTRLLAQEKETTRALAQTLHDELGQTLTALRLHLDASAHLPALPQETRQRVSELVDQANLQVRLVLTELRPPLLDEHGLAAALDNEIKQQRPPGGRPSPRLEAAQELASTRWPPEVEYAAFMIAREALINALRHADAARITIALDGDANELWLTVSDDGSGLEASAMQPRPGHLGLIGMRERALAIGATLTLTAARPYARGTYVNLSWQADADASAGPEKDAA